MVFYLNISTQLHQSLSSFNISLSRCIIKWSLFICVSIIDAATTILNCQLDASCMAFPREVEQNALFQNINISYINSVLNETLYCFFAALIIFDDWGKKYAIVLEGFVFEVTSGDTSVF